MACQPDFWKNHMCPALVKRISLRLPGSTDHLNQVHGSLWFSRIHTL